MVIIFQIAKTFAAKVVCRSVPGLLIWCSAVVPATKSSPMGSTTLADDPPGDAKACELGAYQFL